MIFGALWRLYYGGTFGQRILGKYGPIATLWAALGATLWFTSSNPYTALLVLPLGIMWAPGFGGWDRWLRMACRFTMWTTPIAAAWAVLEADPWKATYAVAGLSGLAYPALNRLQPTPLLGYTQWAEVITGAAMIGGAVAVAVA